jgi:hypothetical protein
LSATPEDRHAERVVGVMLTCLDDFAMTVQPQLDAAMGAHIPGSIKGQERFLARLMAIPSPAIINIAAVFGKRCRFHILLSLWEKDEFGGANAGRLSDRPALHPPLAQRRTTHEA